MYRRLLHGGSIPFKIPQLRFRGKTEGNGILKGYNKEDELSSIPLVILSMRQTRNASDRQGVWNQWNISTRSHRPCSQLSLCLLAIPISRSIMALQYVTMDNPCTWSYIYSSASTSISLEKILTAPLRASSPILSSP